MAVYYLSARYTRLGVTWRNTYAYNTTSAFATAEEALALATSHRTNIVQVGRGVSSDTLFYQDTYVTAPRDPAVFALLASPPPGIAGTVTGDSLPTFVSWGFVCPRERRDIGAGSRRFGLVSESQQAGGIPTGAATTILNNLAAAMSAVLSYNTPSGLQAATPIIVKRIRYTTPSGKVAYRLPGLTDPLEYAAATAWRFAGITTQNTRKVGKGE